MRQACFFDRDGVIIEEADYIHDPDQVRLCPFAAEAVRAMHDAGRLVIVVSNQSGIARGYFTEAELKAVDARMNENSCYAGCAPGAGFAPAASAFFCFLSAFFSRARSRQPSHPA